MLIMASAHGSTNGFWNVSRFLIWNIEPCRRFRPHTRHLLTRSPLSTRNASKSSTRKLIRLRNFYGKHYLFRGKNRFGDKFEECVYSFFRIFIFLLFVTLFARQHRRTFARSLVHSPWMVETRAQQLKWNGPITAAAVALNGESDEFQIMPNYRITTTSDALIFFLNTDSVDMSWNISHISSGSHVKSECVTGIINKHNLSQPIAQLFHDVENSSRLMYLFGELMWVFFVVFFFVLFALLFSASSSPSTKSIFRFCLHKLS